MQPQTIEDEDDGNVKRHSAISVLLAASQTPGVGSGGGGWIWGSKGLLEVDFFKTLKHRSAHSGECWGCMQS